jgi:hypothetical protein
VVEIKGGKLIVRGFPPGRRLVIVPVGEDTYIRRVYNGRSRVTPYPDEKPICAAEMWATLLEAGEEDSVKASLPDDDFQYVFQHYYTSKSYADPKALRA